MRKSNIIPPSPFLDLNLSEITIFIDRNIWEITASEKINLHAIVILYEKGSTRNITMASIKQSDKSRNRIIIKNKSLLLNCESDWAIPPGLRKAKLTCYSNCIDSGISSKKTMKEVKISYIPL